jgi:hypothetical protein
MINDVKKTSSISNYLYIPITVNGLHHSRSLQEKFMSKAQSIEINQKLVPDFGF